MTDLIISRSVGAGSGGTNFTESRSDWMNFSDSVAASSRAISRIAGSQLVTPSTKQSRGNNILRNIDRSRPGRLEVAVTGRASAPHLELRKLSSKAALASAIRE